MPKLPEYPPEIRKRAIELIEETHEDGRRKYSYSQVIAKLREEYPDNERVQSLSKSTLTRWYREHRKHKKQEMEVTKNEEPKEEPKEEATHEPEEAPKEAPEKPPEELKNLSKVSADFVVKDLQKGITEVPDGPLVKEEPKQTEEPETEEPKGIRAKMSDGKVKIIVAVGIVLIIAAAGYLIYRKFKRKEAFPTQETREPQPRTKPEQKREDYKRVTKADEYEEDDYGFADMGVLP